MQTLPLSAPELESRLREHRMLHDLPEDEIRWMAAHSHAFTVAQGEVVYPPDAPIEELLILIKGQVAIYVDRGAGPRRTLEWKAGDIAGVLPYSRLIRSPGTGTIEADSELVSIHRDHFPEMTRECPALTGRLVQVMVDRARIFTQQELHDEKMLSLGRLSAGLAHELDNPASAVMRSAKLLGALLEDVEAASVTIGEAGVPTAQLDVIRQLRNRCVSVRAQHVRSPLEQVRHEEELADWLEDHDVHIANADALAETTITVPMLDDLANRVDPSMLQAALTWVAAGCAARTIVAETGEAAARMSELVKAVRAFTHRDEAATPGPIDVHKGLTETLAVLRSKAKQKSVRVQIQADPDLPPVEAVGGELNQIWSNLIDNALDAVLDGGKVDVVAKHVGDQVQVSVIDDGPGIPPENRERIFEPFFTTKPVGQGTGQGLDIVRRLVAHHRGRLDLFTEPRRTEFRVTLQVAPSAQGRPLEPAGGKDKG